MPSIGKFDWFAPTTMLGALLLGIGAAVGHHCFYASLDGQAVSDDTSNILGVGLSQQQFNLAAGAAFALLARASLVYAAGVAYVQLCWHRVTSGGRGASTTLGTLDDVFQATGNILVMLHFPIWSKYGVTMIVALVTWYGLNKAR